MNRKKLSAFFKGYYNLAKTLWHKKGTLWKYFRDGFSYLTLPLSVISFATTTYYLMIENISFLKVIFPHFYIYVLLMGITIPPVAIFVGWLHFKRSGVYKSEIELAVTSNPVSARQLKVSFGNLMDTRRFQYAVLKKLNFTDEEIMDIMDIVEKEEIVELGNFYDKLDKRWKWHPP